MKKIIVILCILTASLILAACGSERQAQKNAREEAEKYVASAAYRQLGISDAKIESAILFSEDDSNRGLTFRIGVIVEISSGDYLQTVLVQISAGKSRANSFSYINPVDGEDTLSEVLKNKDANIKHAKLVWGW